MTSAQHFLCRRPLAQSASARPRSLSLLHEASENLVLDRKLAYALHFYAKAHNAILRDKAMTLLRNGVPLFVTEWGTCHPEFMTTGIDIEESRRWLSFFAELANHSLHSLTNHISDADWAVIDKDESCHQPYGFGCVNNRCDVISNNPSSAPYLP